MKIVGLSAPSCERKSSLDLLVRKHERHEADDDRSGPCRYKQHISAGTLAVVYKGDG
jgi:hypothetical protein